MFLPLFCPHGLLSSHWSCAPSLIGQDNSQINTWYSASSNWPTSMVLLLGLILLALIIFFYSRERGKATRAIRWLLVGLRVTLLMLLLFMLFGWQKNSVIVEKPELVIVIDTSASMDALDHYEDSEVDEMIAEWVRSRTIAEPTRLNVVKALLSNKRDKWLKRLREDYTVKLFRIDESARVISGEPSDADQRSKDESNQNLDAKAKAETGEQRDSLNDLRADGNASRLGEGIVNLIKLQRGRPTAAILVFTDGVNTSGPKLTDAANLARQKMVPLHIVGIGSSKPPRDIRLGELLVEETVFVDDAVTVDLNVFATGFDGQTVKLTLKEEGKSGVLAETEVKINGENDLAAARLMFRPKKPGEMKLVVEATPLDNEIDNENNRVKRSVRVRDEVIRVLLVAENPNREFHYLKQMLSRAVNRAPVTAPSSGEGSVSQRQLPAEKNTIELKTFLQRGDLRYASTDSTALRVFPVRQEELFDFDVIILCDAAIGNSATPGALGNREIERITEFVAKRGKGLVIIAGPDNGVRKFRDTPAESLLPIDLSGTSIPNPETNLTRTFQFNRTQMGLDWSPFQLGDTALDNDQIWNSLPGAYWSVESQTLRPGARLLASHSRRRTNDDQPMPLIAMQYNGAGKVVFHATAETYRWRFRQGDRWFARYWIQLIRYLSRSKLNEGNGQVRLATDRDTYRQGDEVIVSAIFADDRLAPENDLGVAVSLQSNDGAREAVRLARTTSQRGYFEARLENLAEGEYSLSLVEPIVRDDRPTATFEVSAPQSENAELRMNLDGLTEIADLTGGRMYTIGKTEKMLDELPKGKQVALASLPPEPIWEKWYVVVTFALLFTLLLAAEWIIRKSQWML